MGCKKSFGVTALLLAAPVSESYFRFVLAGVYYVPHLAIAFAALALNEAYFKAKPDRKKFWLVVSVLLALVAGLGGPREIIALYAPLGLRLQQSWSGNGIMKQKGSSLSMRHLLERRH